MVSGKVVSIKKFYLISQYICILNHIVQHKYIQFLLVNYISIKLENVIYNIIEQSWGKKEFYFFFMPFISWIFFKRFFWCGPFFFKSLLNLLQYYFCFMFWFFGHEACGILAPWLGIEPTPPALEGEVLTTALPGKSQKFYLK